MKKNCPYHKLRFVSFCDIKTGGKRIRCRVVYADFLGGIYDRKAWWSPEVVADSEGTYYRHSGITSDGDWMEADNAYFKRWGIPLRIKGGAA